MPIPLLSVDISATYGKKQVLRHLTLDVEPGEILGLVGQSGSGKSTLALATLRLLGPRGGSVSGRIEFNGCDLMAVGERDIRAVRGRDIGLVLQSPLSSLNPALRLETQIREAWRAHARGDWDDQLPRVLDLLRSVGLPADTEFLRRFPRQISLGQAQRVLIAMAVVHRPALLIADEPTSALDMLTQADVLRLLAHFNRDNGMAVLYVSHDLLTVASFCHRVAILYEGQIVEIDTVDNIFTCPAHHFTRRLIQACPVNPFRSSAVLQEQ